MSDNLRILINGQPQILSTDLVDRLQIFSDLTKLLGDSETPSLTVPFDQVLVSRVFDLSLNLDNPDITDFKSLDDQICLILALDYFGCTDKLINKCAQFFMDQKTDKWSFLVQWFRSNKGTSVHLIDPYLRSLNDYSDLESKLLDLAFLIRQTDDARSHSHILSMFIERSFRVFVEEWPRIVREHDLSLRGNGACRDLFPRPNHRCHICTYNFRQFPTNLRKERADLHAQSPPWCMPRHLHFGGADLPPVLSLTPEPNFSVEESLCKKIRNLYFLCGVMANPKVTIYLKDQVYQSVLLTTDLIEISDGTDVRRLVPIEKEFFTDFTWSLSNDLTSALLGIDPKTKQPQSQSLPLDVRVSDLVWSIPQKIWSVCGIVYHSLIGSA